MKNTTLARSLLIASLSLLQTGAALAQTSAFTYQGRLDDGATPANGSFDFMFRLMDAATNGSAASTIPINPGVTVTDGLFTTGVDFGVENLTGGNLWLEISVRTNGGGGFTTLTPRQPLLSAPYAVTARQLSGSLSATQLTGTVPNSQLGGSVSLLGQSIDSDEINDGTIRTNHLDASVLDGSFWKLSGNAGTSPETQFIGTTDDKPLEFKVNGRRGLRLEPTLDSYIYTGAVNVVGGSLANVAGPGVMGATISGGGAVTGYDMPGTNRIDAHFGTIGGGYSNLIQTNADSSTIGGGFNHIIQSNSFFSTISGGYQNTIQLNASFSAVGGGLGNTIQTNAETSSIGGGTGNMIQRFAYSSTIGGGSGNTIQAFASASSIGGGANHTIQTEANYSTVAGGRQNMIQTEAIASAIGGGDLNTIQPNASYAAIPGGQHNAAASFAFAAGRRAKAIHTGTFVWGDSTDLDIASTDPDSVTMRASGGYRLFSNSGAAAGVSLAADGTSWSVLSDRNVKKDFAPVGGVEVLEKLASLPITQWRYNWESENATPHIGPMAQDFKAAFYPGSDDKVITTQEADGVALAAIQGLNQKLEQRLDQKNAEIADLKARLEKLERMLENQGGAR